MCGDWENEIKCQKWLPLTETIYALKHKEMPGGENAIIRQIKPEDIEVTSSRSLINNECITKIKQK